METAVAEIDRYQASRDNGVQHCERQRILLRLHHGFDYAVHGRTAMDGSRNLRNDKGRVLQVAVPLRVLLERVRCLLRGHQPDVDDEVAMDGVGEVEIKNIFSEVSAVTKEKVEVGVVPAVIQGRNQRVVLLGPGLKLEAINLTVV